MTKRILDVGNCGPDHAAITKFFTTHFDCEVAQADRADDAIELMKATPFDLVVVNRKLDVDYSDGIDVIARLKADDQTAAVPVMLITNYAEHQDAAEEAGAVRGFGKLEYGAPETLERVRAVLG
ncbi:MAG: response regulator [Planctomycetota bacterium]